ncbi:RQC domain-containing protein [Ditylenchus destructor]|uniref:RQC domain-containing protein n=1 Tax=Ditylenchus destructor TaxID=166010 RepID=A0AAD4NKU7_9BILA|nr:RQC domain-containing protein [Ditylenchus destructor]
MIEVYLLRNWMDNTAASTNNVNPNASLPQLKCCQTKCCSENSQNVTTRNKPPTLSAYKVPQQPSNFGSKTPLKVLKSELESDEIKPVRTMNITKPQSDMECASPVKPVSILKNSELKASQQQDKVFGRTMRQSMNDSFNDESVDELLEKCCANGGNEMKRKRCIDESHAQQYTGSQEESPREKTIELHEYLGHGIGVKRKSIGTTNSPKATSRRVNMSAEARSVLSSLKQYEPLSITFLIELYRGKLNKNRQDIAIRMGYEKLPMFGRGVQLSAQDVHQFFHAMIKNGFLQETQVRGNYHNKCSYLSVTQKGLDFVGGNGLYAVDLNPAYNTAEKKPRKNETHVTFNLNEPIKQPTTNVKKPDNVEPFEVVQKCKRGGVSRLYNMNGDAEDDRQNLVLEGEMEEVDGVEEFSAIAGPSNISNRRRIGSEPEKEIGRYQVFGFAIGHFYNDLCASMWFTYLMIFMEKVLVLHSYHAGFVCIHEYMLKISHLSMIPELSRSEAKRMSMNSFRYGFTVVANLAIFGCLYLLLNGSAGMSTVIGPHDLHTFRNLGAIAVGVGLITTAIFYLSIKEPPNRRSLSRSNSFHSESSEIVRMSWKNWFSHIHFYQTALLYMFARLFINISQVYFPFYITLSQGKSKEYVAILPMLSYIASFVVSCVLGSPTVSNRLDRKAAQHLAF